MKTKIIMNRGHQDTHVQEIVRHNTMIQTVRKKNPIRHDKVVAIFRIKNK